MPRPRRHSTRHDESHSLARGCGPAGLRGLLSRYQRGEALYHRERDPEERNDLARAEPERTARYRALLFATLRAARAEGGAHRREGPLGIPPQLAEELRALGYLE